MGGHYERGLFNQLMEVQARLEAMEEAHKKDRKEIAFLTGEVKSLGKENQALRTELTAVREENRTIRGENTELRKENDLLRQAILPCHHRVMRGKGRQPIRITAGKRQGRRREARKATPADIFPVRKWNAKSEKAFTNTVSRKSGRQAEHM